MPTNLSDWEAVDTESTSDWEPVAAGDWEPVIERSPEELEAEILSLGRASQQQAAIGRGMEAGDSFLSSVASDPLAFAKSIPEIALGALASPGKLAYYGAADAIAALQPQSVDVTGPGAEDVIVREPDRSFGGNLASLMGPGEAPVDRFLAEASKSVPGLTTAAKVGKAASEMSGLGVVGLLPRGLAALASAGFTADMIRHAPEQFAAYAEEVNKPVDEQDPDKLTTLKSDIIQTFTFAPLAGAHAARVVPEQIALGLDKLRRATVPEGRPSTVFEPPKPADVFKGMSEVSKEWIPVEPVETTSGTTGAAIPAKPPTRTEQAPINPGGHSSALPPEAAAIEAANKAKQKAKQKAIAEEFKKGATAPPQPEMVGLGGALAGEVAPSGTSLKNAVGELERATHGLPEEYPTQHRKMAPVWEEAGEVLRNDPAAGEKLAAELKINPERGMTDTDSAVLLRHKVELENRKNQAAEDTITAKTPEEKIEAQQRFDSLSDQLLDILDSAKFRGSQWGREGRWRQALAFEDFSLETMRREAKVKADRELTPQEEASIKAAHDKITSAQKEADAKTAQESTAQRGAVVDEAVADAVKTGRASAASDKKAGVVRDLEAEQSSIVDHLKEHFTEEGALSGKEMSVRKLMELLVEREGITERLPLETRVHEILSQVDPTLTREGTLDLMSGYGKSKVPSQDPVKKTVRDIAAQILSVRKLLDYFKGERPKLTGNLRDAPSDIQRMWLKVVNEAKKNFKLDGPVDSERSIKSALDAVNTRLKNRLSDLRQEVATRKKIIRERSPSPYNEETLRLRAEIEAVKKLHDEIFGGEMTPAERLARAEKSAERQITELERQINSGEIFPKSKQAFGLRSDKLDAAKARLEELKLQRQFAREALQPRPEPEAAKADARVKSLDKQIESIEKQLADDAVFSKSKQARTPSEDARILEREKRLEELKESRKYARERLQPGIEPHEAFALNYLMRLRQREAQYRERLATQDFGKKVKPEREITPDLAKALADVEKAKNDFRAGLHQYELSRRTVGRKIWDAIKTTRGAVVNIASSYDFSAPRQALFTILSNSTRLITSPRQGASLLAKPAVNMFKAWASEPRAAVIDQQIKNRPNAKSGADKTAGIEYTELATEKFSKHEENAHSIIDQWAELPLRTGSAVKTAATIVPKIASRGVRMSNRAFITFLNQTRAGLFDEILSQNFKDRAPTELELQIIGNLVNVATGRGKMAPTTSKAASELLWSPKLLASRIQAVAGQPLWTGKWAESGRARRIVAEEYARAIMGGFLLWQVSRMFDDKKEGDPRSSDYGKIVRGNTRIDPWGGFQQVTTLGSRLATGQTKTLKGDVRDIDAARKYGQKGVWHTMADFGRSKLRPDVGAVIDIVSGENVIGEPTTPSTVAESLLVPLPMRDIVTIMKEHGFTEGMIIDALGQFGAGISVHEKIERQR